VIDDMATDLENGADMAGDVAINMVGDMVNDISSTTHEWMGPIQSGPLSWT